MALRPQLLVLGGGFGGIGAARHLTARTAFLAWGAVHLALLSTGEDRAKAVVDWTRSGFSHERPGRISIRPDRP